MHLLEVWKTLSNINYLISLDQNYFLSISTFKTPSKLKLSIPLSLFWIQSVIMYSLNFPSLSFFLLYMLVLSFQNVCFTTLFSKYSAKYGDHLTQGSSPGLPALQADSLPLEPTGKPQTLLLQSLKKHIHTQISAF